MSDPVVAGAKARPEAPQMKALPRHLEAFEKSHFESLIDEGDGRIEGHFIDPIKCQSADIIFSGNNLWSKVRVGGGQLHEASFQRAELTDVEFSGTDLSNLNFHEASLLRVAARNCRALGMQLTESLWKHGEIDGSKLDMASLRFSTIQRVVISDCSMRDAEFGGATFESVLFDRCDFTGSDFSNVTFKRCEMRQCTLDDVRGLTSLQGVAMEWADIVALAPMLAHALGIRIIDTEA